MPNFGGYEATDGVVFVVIKVCIKARIEIRNRGQGIHHKLPIGLCCNQLAFVAGIVMLVVDLANDLFQHIFNGDQTGHTTVFINHNRHMVA